MTLNPWSRDRTNFLHDTLDVGTLGIPQCGPQPRYVMGQTIGVQFEDPELVKAISGVTDPIAAAGGAE